MAFLCQSSWCAQSLPIILTKGRFRCWGSPCRIWKSALACSWITAWVEDEKRRPGTKIGIARWMADRAVDVIRDRFGWHSIGYGSVALELSRSVPDEFRELAEKDR